MKVTYLIMGCPWYMKTASQHIFLPKTSTESNPESGRKLEESGVVRESLKPQEVIGLTNR